MSNPRPVLIDMHEGREIAVPSSIAGGDIDRQIATAHAFPRSLERFRTNTRMQSTLNDDIAAQCIYAMKRGGKTIEGPSVRFAEIALAAWGNCRAASAIIAEERDWVKAHGLFWDLETNAALGFEVKRRIVDSNGNRYGADMIGVTGNAAASIAMRNAILRGVPQALWWDIYLEARGAAVGKLSTLAERRQKAVDYFKRFGVSERQVLESVNVSKFDEIGLEQLAMLRGYITAIQSEERDPEQIFGAISNKPPPPAPPAPPAPPSPPKAKDADSGAPEPTPLEMSIAQMLLDAKSRSDVEAVPQLFDEDIQNAPADVRARISVQVAEARQRVMPT